MNKELRDKLIDVDGMYSLIKTPEDLDKLSKQYIGDSKAFRDGFTMSCCIVKKLMENHNEESELSYALDALCKSTGKEHKLEFVNETFTYKDKVYIIDKSYLDELLMLREDARDAGFGRQVQVNKLEDFIRTHAKEVDFYGL